MASYTTAATGTAGTYTTAEEELRKKKRQALLDAQARAPLPQGIDSRGRDNTIAPPPRRVVSTGGGPGGIVGPGGESPNPYPPQTPTAPPNYNLPADLQASRDAAYQREMVAAQQGVASDYASQERQLKETLARMGYSGPDVQAGEGGNRLWSLRGQEATDIANARNAVLGRQSAENLGWATGERTFQQNQALQQAGLSSTEKIAGMNIDQSKWLADKTAELTRQGWGAEEASAEANRQWQTTERTGSQTWQSGETQRTQAFTKEMQNQADNLVQAGWSKDAAQAEIARRWQTSERAGTQNWQAGQTAAGQTWQTGERIGAEAATAQRDAYAATLQREGWDKQSAEAEADRKFQSAMQASQFGQAKDITYITADLAKQMEQFKYDKSVETQTRQAIYDGMQQYLQGLVNPERWQEYKKYLDTMPGADTTNLPSGSTTGPKVGDTRNVGNTTQRWDGTKWVTFSW